MKGLVIVSLLVLFSCVCYATFPQVVPGNCYSSCSSDKDCGTGASKDCNTCVNGKCTCASGGIPCVNDDWILNGNLFMTYSCINASLKATPCKQGIFGQPAGVCDYTCSNGDQCCDSLVGSKCYNPKTSFCCAQSDSWIATTCANGNLCTPNPLLSVIKADCIDVNECKQNSTICGAGYTCNNTAGSYQCLDVNECAKTPSICKFGYTCTNTPGGYTCDDVNECARTGMCPSGFYCVNTPGSYQCQDIDECNQTVAVCGPGYACTNQPGNYTCSDIDECAQNETICGSGYTCSNTQGNYTCEDINECAFTTCSIYSTCVNYPGNFSCEPLEFYLRNAMAGLVLGPKDGASAEGTSVVTQVNVGLASQRWKYTSDLYLVNVDSGLVLDMQYGVPNAGGSIILWSKKTTGWAGNQHWQYNDTTQQLTSLAGGIALDIFNEDPSPGTKAIVWWPKEDGNPNQKFKFVQA